MNDPVGLRSNRVLAKTKASRFNAIERLLQSSRFETAWFGATPNQQNKVEPLIDHGRLEGLRQWVKEVMEDTYESMSYQELRKLASKRNIPYYSRMFKDELITKLEEYDESNK